MHIKFLKHGNGSSGSGSGRKAANYLLQEKDHTGKLRESIKVLAGNPDHVAKTADHIKYQHKYTSAIISFAPTDKPTPKQINAVLKDFVQVSCGGLDRDRVALTAVQHTDQDHSVHVHVLIANVDLATGKSFNPAPPGWMKAFDPVRDYHNLSNEWARPDDKKHARTIGFTPRNLPKNAKKIRAGLNAVIKNGVETGLICNRQDVVKELSRFGKITRQSKNFISVKPACLKKPIRLKGAIYGKEFSVGTGKKITIESERTDVKNERDRQNRIAESKAKFTAEYRKRVEYNTKTYRIEHDKNQNIDKNEHDKKSNHDICDLHRDIVRVGNRSLQSDSLSIKQDNESDRDNTRITESEQRTPSFTNSRSDEKKSDRTEKKTRLVAVSKRNMGNTNQPIKKKNKKTEIGLYMKNSNSEIEKFKTEIDLCRYLESQGWQKDYNASCRSSAVLRQNNEKIIVGKQRGHFVYKNTKRPGDQGSIIEYIQKRKKINLGQVRKILRPALHNQNFKSLHDWKAPKYAINQAQDKWLNNKDVFDFDYLNKRGIKKETVQTYSFVIKQNPNNKNLMFAHRGPDGFSGYEIKGPGEPRGKFSAGGKKSFFPLQREKESVSRIVITETAIDALSKAQMEGMRKDTAYVSTAGNPSDTQLEQLFNLCQQTRIKKVVLAQDNDKGGDEQAEKYQEILQNAPIEIEREIPEVGKDWNEMLTEQIKQQQEENEKLKEEQEEKEYDHYHGMEM